MSKLDEIELTKIRTGDHDAFANYMESRRLQLLAYIERNLSDGLRKKVDAEDLYQEVSVDCFRSLAEVDLSEREPFSWMCQVAERKIIDAHRKFFGTQKRAADREVPLGTPGGEPGQAAVIDLLIASITSPSKAFSRNQKQIRMLSAIDSLSKESQDILRMRFAEELPTKIIAERMGKSDVAVRVLVTRTIKKLQQLLEVES